MSPRNNYWSIKPFWCQPWTIIMTGLCILFSAWKIFDNLIIITLISISILIWWILFLIIAPILYEKDIG